MMDRLIELYREWNGKINVISRKDIDNIYGHHILHSLAIAEYLKDEMPDEFARWCGNSGGPGVKVLDLGTGGGFPGIPLAVTFPSVHFDLCDSIAKKIKVASSVAEAMHLDNVTAINARAETLPGKYDWVVSRAVTSLDNFYPWVKDKYIRGILYLKGGDFNDEISVIQSRYGVAVSLWPISRWLEDEYYSDKYVVKITKK